MTISVQNKSAHSFAEEMKELSDTALQIAKKEADREYTGRYKAENKESVYFDEARFGVWLQQNHVEEYNDYVKRRYGELYTEFKRLFALKIIFPSQNISK